MSKKRIKYVMLLLALPLLLTGCAKGKKADKEMMDTLFAGITVNKEIISFNQHLVISSKFENESINELIQITKTKDEVKIVNSNDNQRDYNNEKEPEINIMEEKYSLYKDGKSYYFDGKELNEIDSINYYNPDNLLNLLDNYKKVKKIEDTKVGKRMYKTYKLTINSKEMKKAISDTKIKDLKIEGDTTLTVSVDENHFPWQIEIIFADDLYLRATYSNFNK